MSHNLIIERLCVLKMAAVSKCLNETTEVVRDIKRHQANTKTHRLTSLSFLAEICYKLFQLWHYNFYTDQFTEKMFGNCVVIA